MGKCVYFNLVKIKKFKNPEKSEKRLENGRKCDKKFRENLGINGNF